MLDVLSDFQDYLVHQKSVSKNTRQSYLQDLEHFIRCLPALQIEDATLATTATIEQYLAQLEETGRSNATIIRNVASIRCYYQFLVDCGRVTGNPAKEVKRKKVEKKLPCILTGPEIERLLAQPNIREPKGCRDRAMLELLYATGIRVTELIELNLEDLNFQTGMLYCNKGKIARSIPVYEEAVAAVLDYTAHYRSKMLNGNDGQALFVNLNGHRMTRQGFWKIIKGYAEQAQITKEITPHTLRHSFALHLLENGAQLKDIQAMMGHMDISSTQIYMQVLNDRHKEVYNSCHPKARKKAVNIDKEMEKL